MPAVQCPSCAKTLNIPDQYAGRKVRCPGCQGVLAVPAAAAVPPPPPEASVEVTPAASRSRPPEGRRAAPPPDDYDDRPRRRPRRDDDYDDRPRRRRPYRGGEWAPCPSCGCQEGTRQHWTFWGGLIGPAIINCVRCNDCGTSYNGVHGDYNGGRIAIYIVVSLVLGLLVAGLVIVGTIAANG